MSIKTLEFLLARYVSMRPRSEQESRKYLAQKSRKYPATQEEIDRLVAKYMRIGFIDDQKFAESQANSIVRNKSKGGRILAMKLKFAGIDPELAKSTLASINPDDVTIAMEKRVKRYHSKLVALEPRMRSAKAFQILFTSGFSSSEIRPFLDEWLKKEYDNGT